MNRKVIGPIQRVFSMAALLCTSLSIAAQTTDLHHQVLTTWTTDQGLPQNFVRAITQTADGFLWVGTMNGLARFDGVRFRTFSRDGPPELQQSIVGLAPDAADGLWIATVSQLLHYTHRKFEPVQFEGKPHYRIDGMIGEPYGEALIYSGGKLAHTHMEQLQTLVLPGEAHPIRDFAESPDGTLWLADGEAIYSIRNKAAPTRYALPGARLVYADSFGDVFAGDGHKLFRLEAGQYKEWKSPGLTNFVGLLVDHQHRLWMASGGLHGLSRNANGAIEILTSNDGLAANDVREIFEDRSGDIWLGSIAGLQRLHAGLFTTYTDHDGMKNSGDQFETVFEQKGGTIWAGTLEGGVASLTDNKAHRYGGETGLSSGQIRGFIDDGEVPQIAVADYGIFTYRNSHFTKLPGVPHGYVQTPVKTPDGSLWFSVDHQGLFRWRDGQSTHFGPAEGLPAGTIASIAIDSSGTLWVGTENRLVRWNGAGFDIALKSPSPIISMAWPRSDHAALGEALGTFNGLLLKTVTSTEARILTQKEGLPGDTVLDVLSDDDGSLFIATTRTIARIDRAQWTAYAEHRSDHVDAQIYTQADGLKSNAVLPLNTVTAIRAHDGNLWFATPQGISRINSKLKAEPQLQAVVDSVIVDDQPQDLFNLVVPPGQHRITFAFTAPPGVAAAQTRFRYRLVGWDREWIDSGTDREVSYTALPPATYSFEVTAINRDGISSAMPASITMRLKPYFWQTRIFLVLCIVLAIAIIVEVTRRRTRINAERLSLRFQERVAERERIAYQIHDTVIQDMIGAALQVELLGFQIADTPDRAHGLLESLAQRLRETIERSRNMVGNLHSTAVAQYNLVEVLRHAEAEFRLSPLPHFELISIGEARNIHPLVRDEVYRICREALANAFRHAEAQHVRVTLKFTPHLLEVEISDDGHGIDEYTRLHGRPGHFGLPGMQAHAARIGAEIAIDSAPGEGTRVVLCVKTSRDTWRMPWRKRDAALLIQQNGAEPDERDR